MERKPELLAPAGDLERLKIALLYGADAVYIGGPLLNLRANAINFTFDEIKEGVIFAHNLNKKVYVTVNIVLNSFNIELDKFISVIEMFRCVNKENVDDLEDKINKSFSNVDNGFLNTKTIYKVKKDAK